MGGCLSASALPPPNPLCVDLTHFELLKVVGKGGFGKVNAITSLTTNELLALKRMEKAKVLKSKSHLSMVWTERLIMSLVESPFLCHLKYAFESDTELFLVMPFLQGGDLRYHLRERGRMSESTARFYAAEMIVGLEELHSKNIVYRDLKPENVLLDENGHLRITDFGLACILKPDDDYKTRGQAGTRGYMAPETLALKGYGLSVDFFSFGVMIYELLHGSRPWKSFDPTAAMAEMGEEPDLIAAAKTKRAVQKKSDKSPNSDDGDDEDADAPINEIRFSSRLSDDARSLLTKLLVFNPQYRLGCSSESRGWASVKRHPFFQRVDWHAMQQRAVRPPFQPDISQANCTPDADLADQLLDKKPKKITDEEQKAFVGWSWNTAIAQPKGEVVVTELTSSSNPPTPQITKQQSHSSNQHSNNPPQRQLSNQSQPSQPQSHQSNQSNNQSAEPPVHQSAHNHSTNQQSISPTNANDVHSAHIAADAPSRTTTVHAESRTTTAHQSPVDDEDDTRPVATSISSPQRTIQPIAREHHSEAHSNQETTLPLSVPTVDPDTNDMPASERADSLGPLSTPTTDISLPVQPSSPGHSLPVTLQHRNTMSGSLTRLTAHHDADTVLLPNTATEPEPNSPALPILSLPSSTRPSITITPLTNHTSTTSSHRKSVSVGHLNLHIASKTASSTIHESSTNSNSEAPHLNPIKLEPTSDKIDRRWTLGRTIATQ